MAKESKNKVINITNRKAEYEYQFVAEYNAGLVLTGTEIKSIRAGYANLNDAFCTFTEGELLVRSLHIAEYASGSFFNHEAKRVRKLLLRKPELKKLERRVSEKGFTIVPYRLFISDRGFAKLTVVLAQGKKTFDKRETIKERENKRELDRIKKSYK
jgi:SsrA-binding protein